MIMDGSIFQEKYPTFVFLELIMVIIWDALIVFLMVSKLSIQDITKTIDPGNAIATPNTE